MWEALMQELRFRHLGAPAPATSVMQELQEAHERVVSEQRTSTPPG